MNKTWVIVTEDHRYVGGIYYKKGEVGYIDGYITDYSMNTNGVASAVVIINEFFKTVPVDCLRVDTRNHNLNVLLDEK